MELKGRDVYRLELLGNICETDYFSVLSLYQPCVGPIATTLYLSLVSEYKYQKSADNIMRLCTIMSSDVLLLEKAFTKLEEFNLVKTYYKKDTNKNNFIFSLNTPLSPKAFIKHDVYGRLFLKIVGTKHYQVTVEKMNINKFNKTEFEDVSANFQVDALDGWNNDFEVDFKNVKPNYVFNDIKEEIKFDYEHFLAKSTNLTFPIGLRTNENMHLIGQLATIYGIKADRMRILVGHCANNDGVMNTDMLKRLASYEKTEAYVPKNKYDIAPVLFLKNIQNGVNVTQIDKKLIENLISEYNFKAEVVNVLIEHVLKVNDNRLTKGFVDSIAGVLIREEVNSVESCLKVLKSNSFKPFKKSTRKAKEPDYLSSDKFVDDEEVDMDEIQRKLNKLGN